MRDETKIDVYTSGVTGAEYDAGMKQLMSNKEIIVPILQMTVSEFKTCRILCSQRPFISVKYYYADYSHLYTYTKKRLSRNRNSVLTKETKNTDRALEQK